MSLPFSQAADRNKEAIGDALQPLLSNATSVFEFGSGTAQHAVYLCQRYPHLLWQPSDLALNLDAIEQRTQGAGNIAAPVECDVLNMAQHYLVQNHALENALEHAGERIPNRAQNKAPSSGKHTVNNITGVTSATDKVNLVHYSLAYSANTAHIMSMDAVAQMISCASALLQPDGSFALYGPFRYGSTKMTDGNIRFDAMLRDQSAAMGIRDKFELDQLAIENGLVPTDDLSMPSNNRILIWQKVPATE